MYLVYTKYTSDKVKRSITHRERCSSKIRQQLASFCTQTITNDCSNNINMAIVYMVQKLICATIEIICAFVQNTYALGVIDRFTVGLVLFSLTGNSI